MHCRRALLAASLVLSSTWALAQERISDQIYMKSGGAAFTLDVFKCGKPNAPAVIWLCSGGWFSRHEDINPAIAKPFNDKGITVIEVVHGSQPKYKIQEILPMIRRAVRYVHANAKRFEIDGQRIGISGGSAGGHLSLMIAGTGDDGKADAKDPVEQAASKVNAVGVFFPPTDFLDWGADGYIPFQNPMMGAFLPAFGVTAKTPLEDLKTMGHDLSPIFTIGPAFPPTLLIHGDSDKVVPLQQSQIFDAALEKAKIEHKLIVIPGGGHDNKTLFPGFPMLVDWYVKRFGI